MRMRTLVVPLLVVGAVAMARRRSQVPPGDLWVDTPAPSPELDLPPVRLASVRSGDRDARGSGGTVRMDLDRARAARVDPVVEFLTYVQQRRGDREHLLFVRTDDLDAMAEAADEPVDDFLARLDQLGVVVSHN